MFSVIEPAVGGLTAMAKFWVASREKKQENKEAALELIEASSGLTDYLIEIREAIQVRAGEGTLHSFSKCEELLGGSVKLLDQYYKDKNSLMKAVLYNARFNAFAEKIKQGRVHINQEFTVFCAKNPEPQAIVPQPVPPVPIVMLAAPPVTHGLVTQYLKMNHPELAEQRKRNKEFSQMSLEEKNDLANAFIKNENYAEAFKILIQLDSPSAYYNLGRMYRKGQGIEINLGKAKEFYNKAAEQNNDPGIAARACLDLAVICALENDIAGALKIFQGLAEAEEELPEDIRTAAINNMRQLKQKQNPSMKL